MERPLHPTSSGGFPHALEPPWPPISLIHSNFCINLSSPVLLPTPLAVLLEPQGLKPQHQSKVPREEALCCFCIAAPGQRAGRAVPVPPPTPSCLWEPTLGGAESIGAVKVRQEAWGRVSCPCCAWRRAPRQGDQCGAESHSSHLQWCIRMSSPAGTRLRSG